MPRPPHPPTDRRDPGFALRCRRIGGGALTLLLLAATGLGCGSRQPAARAPEPPQPTPQQQAAARCRQRHDSLLSQLQELRRAEQQLNRLRQAPMPATPGRPYWDEEKESRYSQEDQELDRQAYERQLAAWQELDDQRWRAWQQRQTPELQQAQKRLNRLTRQLHDAHPQLFTAPDSIEVKPQELARLGRCAAPPG